MAGLWYEDLEPGRVFAHPITRTITESDNVLFCCLTHNPQPLHLDREFAAGTEFGQPLVNSLLTLSMMVGVAVNDITTGTTVANLGFSEVRFPAPVFHGDTLRFETEVANRRISRSRPWAGIVELLHRAYNQHGTLVAECRRQVMIRRRPQQPAEPKE